MSDTPHAARPSILESPWYWVYAFCTAGLVALMLMGPKFGARQAQIEREYQGRQRAAQHTAGQQPLTPMSSEDDTAITLWPLYLILAAVFLVAWFGLWWHYFRCPRDAGPESSGRKINSAFD